MSDQPPGDDAERIQALRAEEAAREERVRQQYFALIFVSAPRESRITGFMKP